MPKQLNVRVDDSTYDSLRRWAEDHSVTLRDALQQAIGKLDPGAVQRPLASASRSTKHAAMRDEIYRLLQEHGPLGPTAIWQKLRKTARFWAEPYSKVYRVLRDSPNLVREAGGLYNAAPGAAFSPEGRRQVGLADALRPNSPQVIEGEAGA